MLEHREQISEISEQAIKGRMLSPNLLIFFFARHVFVEPRGCGMQRAKKEPRHASGVDLWLVRKRRH